MTIQTVAPDKAVELANNKIPLSAISRAPPALFAGGRARKGGLPRTAALDLPGAWAVYYEAGNEREEASAGRRSSLTGSATPLAFPWRKPACGAVHLD
jgi:hypothetical protein